MPVRIGDPPARVRVLAEHLQSFGLLLLRQMEPEFEDQRAFLYQHGFKAVDIAELPVEIRTPDLRGCSEIS
jgi:hypothetical protein